MWVFGDRSVTKVHPSAYRPLLEAIAKGESNGNYNAYFSNGSNTEVRFTEMSIDEVLQWQDDFVKQGNPSSAVGKYQIIRPTLQSLVRDLRVDKQAPFDTAMQDSLAIALMERRGSIAFVDNEMTKEQFAHELSKEWAALPAVTGNSPAQSYYEGDGLNKARITVKEISMVIETFEANARMSQQ